MRTVNSMPRAMSPKTRAALEYLYFICEGDGHTYCLFNRMASIANAGARASLYSLMRKKGIPNKKFLKMSFADVAESIAAAS